MDALFQALVENSADAIVMLNADGTIRFASESSVRLLGYTLDERVGRSGFELMHPEDVPGTKAAFADMLSRPGVPTPSEYRVLHKDGTWRNIEAIAVNRLNDPAIGAVVVNYRDVTARRRAEEALRASEERLRHIVEHAQDLIYYCDPSGRFTYVNPTAARVMSYGERELIGRHFVTLIRPDYQAEAAEVYLRQLRERTPTTYMEFPVVTKTGGAIWVGQHVQLVYDGDAITAVHAIARDITRQKAAEEQLRRSEARYRSLIQGAAYGIYRTTVGGVILDANPALAHMLGYESVEALMSLNMSTIYASSAEREALIDRRDEPGRERISADMTWTRRNGALITVRITARVVKLPGEEEICFEGIAEDITERRVLEEQLRQAQKMEAVGRLARGVAHDFNNVLAAIVGCSDLLLARLAADEPAREDAEEIHRAAERGAALTRQLLTFSRRQALEPAVLDVHAAVRGLESMLVRLTGELTLRLDTPGAPPHVHVEPGQIEQVLLNLVVNARDAIKGDGTIDIIAEAVDLDERTTVDFPGMPPGAYARIAVRDTGAGIAPDVQRHVFEPFFTTKGPEKGTGLGLSIVYGIAKEAGGTVRFATSENGTTFEVLLPRIDEING